MPWTGKTTLALRPVRWINYFFIGAFLFYAGLSALGMYLVFKGHVLSQAKEQALELSQAILASQKSLLFHPAPQASRSRLRLAPDAYPEFDSYIRKFLLPFRVVKVKIFNADREIIYSTEPEIIGRKETGNTKLSQALQGTVVQGIKTKDEVLDLEGEKRIHINTTHVYLPVRDAGRQVVGSFEIYTDITRDLQAFYLNLVKMLAFIAILLGITFGFLRHLILKMVRQMDTHAQSRRKNLIKLRKQSRLLRKRNTELENFTFIASHDLKEPLRKILTFGERLMDRIGERLDPKARDYWNRIERATRRMQQFLDDLTDLTRLTNAPSHPEPLDLRQILEELAWEGKTGLQSRRGTLEISSLCHLEADRTHIRILFHNLLSNSIKYAHPERPLRIRVSGRVEPDRGRYIIDYRDNGIGFENKYQERIFQPFERLHGKSAYDGTGMGLAICQKIASLYGFQMRAEGRPGEGARFLIEIPRQAIQQPPDQEPDPQNMVP